MPGFNIESGAEYTCTYTFFGFRCVCVVDVGRYCFRPEVINLVIYRVNIIVILYDVSLVYSVVGPSKWWTFCGGVEVDDFGVSVLIVSPSLNATITESGNGVKMN